jgi:4,5-dihydroxyphthalate decarboxylase
MKLPLTMAAVNYDRFRAIEDGRVNVEGIDLEILPMEVEEIFYRQAKYAEFDISEMSLSTYVLSMRREGYPYIAIPVFPSRYFRHQTMFVNSSSGIARPQDLIGKRVGIPEYQLTAMVWQRGMLSDDYDVHPEDIHWFVGGVDQTGREEKAKVTLPAGVKATPIGPDQTLSQMLAAGELDAVFTANVPRAFYDSDNVKRLFPDYKATEKDYFERTGIFPIMHVIVIRKETLAEDPWIARSLYKAFDAARTVAAEDLMYRSSLKVMLPWLADHVEETVSALGEDYWTYGIEQNKKVLETFLRYSYDQGLAEKEFSPEELFVPSTSSTFIV